MKQILVFTITAALFLAAACRPAGPGAESKRNNDFIIEPGVRLGPITASTTEEELAKLFGAKNVRRDTIWFAEGHSESGTVVFPGTPNEIEIIWTEEGAPSLIRLRHKEADWTAASGLKVGSSLEDVEKLNMRPFQFYGFGWDFGGAITDWKGGRMTPALMVTLMPSDMDVLDERFWGEVVLSSDDPELKSANIVVSALMISFD